MPSASAFTMSGPERAPESKRTGVSGAVWAACAKQSLAARLPLAWQPPWLER